MLSDNIKLYRKANGLSQDELAEKLDVSRQSVSLWENGQTQPTIENIIALAKIFNISSDELLEISPAVQAEPEYTPEKSDSPFAEKVTPSASNIKKPVIFIAAVAVVVVAVVLILSLGGCKDGNTAAPSEPSAQPPAASSVPQSSPNPQTSDEPAPAEEVIPAVSVSAEPSESIPVDDEKVVIDDLFTYCKNFAIEIGTINGDYCMYQQPATMYGGFKDEFFSLSYWADSDMVEFCLHCPLSDEQSINFYLRMRGGFDGTYEYCTSKYYRETGDSIRSAYGIIDPAVFSDSYPLSCDNYYGSTDGQTEFMEESRVGICDLIHLMKEFVEVENMACDFSAFEFANF